MTTTPRPWKLFLGPMNSIGIGPSASTIVCEMRRTRPSHWDSRELDARLIAAAPEMLALLRRLIEEGAYDDEGDYVLPHPPPTMKDEDYLDHPVIADARALLARIDKGEVTP